MKLINPNYKKLNISLKLYYKIIDLYENDIEICKNNRIKSIEQKYEYIIHINMWYTKFSTRQNKDIERYNKIINGYNYEYCHSKHKTKIEIVTIEQPYKIPTQQQQVTTKRTRRRRTRRRILAIR